MKTEATETTAAAGVVAKLEAYKRANGGDVTTTLPATDLTVSYPAFIGHDQVMNATKIAGKNRSKTGMVLVAQVCKFEGERLTVGQIGSLVPNADVVHLINLLMGEDDDAGEGESSGN
ncbi:hypothetical protein VSX64_14530 [Aurantimonas sp. C2-6-R+9]|uniref:hypothetical protein n=1 Tax=unclassified Aurantimonas TaxID=2638230 RepID=UPI002E180FCF|nr:MULTISPECIES: hypothetical protein [unclassified Aurantimonas]MEC5291972.1 hypothetical protein [Aurantimonas sp. C2-3-R2]MEC5382084.1 hypothetical protein [Aurantimonas sp. C2-6-R+9]MEC5413057.1 hypothetical protein [Aurantimonas sp. C2-4-R8]